MSSNNYSVDDGDGTNLCGGLTREAAKRSSTPTGRVWRAWSTAKATKSALNPTTPSPTPMPTTTTDPPPWAPLPATPPTPPS
jgi:hypothetical protein